MSLSCPLALERILIAKTKTKRWLAMATVPPPSFHPRARLGSVQLPRSNTGSDRLELAVAGGAHDDQDRFRLVDLSTARDAPDRPELVNFGG